MHGDKKSRTCGHARWIEDERAEALLGKGTDKSESDIRHEESAFLSFGAGPRVCPGKVRLQPF